MHERGDRNAHIFHYFTECITRGVLHHTYLFIGPDNNAQHDVVQHITCALAPAEYRAFNAGVFDSDNRHIMSIDDARDMIQLLWKTSLGYARRVIVVQNAHTLSEAVGNALLKVCEEPPPDTVFIFCAPHDRGVLSTLVSRCHRIRFTGRSNNRRTQEPNGNFFEKSLGEQLIALSPTTFPDMRMLEYALWNSIFASHSDPVQLERVCRYYDALREAYRHRALHGSFQAALDVCVL